MNWLLRLLFAPGCLICKGSAESDFCDDCEADFRPLSGPLCPWCSQPVRCEGPCARCRVKTPVFDGVTCAYEHRGALKKALHLLKFQRRRALAGPLGERLAAVFVPQAGEAIVPVPLHPERQRERGFNQAELLARGLPGPLRSELLRRSHATAHQFQQSDAVRLANVARAFEAGPVRGLRIVLVDDIMTTGATLNACAETLRAAGALTVRAVTLTRTVAQSQRPRRAA